MLMDLKFALKCACGWASHPWPRQLIEPNDFVGPVVFLPTMLFISQRNVIVIVSCMNFLPSKQWNQWIPLICRGKQREMQMLYSYWFCKIVDGCNPVVYRSKRLYKSPWNIIWRNICKKKTIMYKVGVYHLLSTPLKKLQSKSFVQGSHWIWKNEKDFLSWKNYGICVRSWKCSLFQFSMIPSLGVFFCTLCQG